MGSITEIGDKIEIQELMAKYSFTLDFGDIEGCVNLFTEDGVLESPFGTFKGATTLRQYFYERWKKDGEHPLRHLRHLQMNIVIDIHGDRASAKCFLLLTRATPEGVELLTTGIYNDELRKVEGAWRFSLRKIEVDSKMWTGNVPRADVLKKSKG